MPIFSVALYAAKVTTDERGSSRVNVFLQAAFADAESEDEAKETWLAFMLKAAPVADGWTAHAVSVQFVLDLEAIYERWERGETVELAPDEEFITDLLQ